MVCPRGFHASDRYTEARIFRARHSQLPSLDIKCDRVYLFSSVSGLGQLTVGAIDELPLPKTPSRVRRFLYLQVLSQILGSDAPYQKLNVQCRDIIRNPHLSVLGLTHKPQKPGFCENTSPQPKNSVKTRFLCRSASVRSISTC